MEGNQRDASDEARSNVRCDSPSSISRGTRTLPGAEVNQLLARNVPDGEFFDTLEFPADLADESPADT
ncbi:MAG: hypothetical protein WC558_10075 [Patulibacter sp.]